MKYNKYKNKWTKCNQGHNHQSEMEAEYCNYLQSLKEKGIIRDFETQKNFKLFCNFIHICDHKVDFVLIFPDNKLEVREVKGKELQEWKLKRKLFEAQYDIPYVVIKKKEIKKYRTFHTKEEK